jgi:hypothetical protein
MAQKTNLNVSPYFDDFDAGKNFYKVLFNPGRPVQARELNNIQSILQNQIESFGSHLFKEGSVVIPGNITYDPNFFAVKLNSTSFGVNVSSYIQQYVGKLIEGQISGITAFVQKVEIPSSTNNLDYITLYVKYIDSDNDFKINPFQDGETLVCNESIVYGNTTIFAGTPFGSLISTEATFTGSAASIDNGIYFVRGTFAKVSQQTIILDYYTNTPSYRIGLNVSEEIVSAKEDPSLYDNAKGFTNYAAPGADRFKISLSLTKKTIDSVDTDTDFVELLRVENGEIKKINTKTQYSLIKDYLAQRTFDESGNYSVEPFKISLHNSLNTRLGNNGLFFDNQKTESGNTPSDDLMCVKLSPGKAYVKGYDIEKITTTILDVNKPRETQKVENVSVPFEMGNLLRVNNVFGSPKQNETIELHSERRSSSGNPSSSTKIGDARVYNFRLTDAAYSGESTNWDLYLYDIQTYTTLTLNQPLSATELPSSSYIKGKSSGASGYASAAGDDTTTIKLRQTSGSFIRGEQILINGLELYPRSITQITAYDSSDIKQIYQPTSVSGFTTSFIGDSVLDKQLPIGFNASDTIQISAGGVVTSPGKVFNAIKPGSILRYQAPGKSSETFNIVSSVSSTGTSMTVVGVTTVNGVCDGAVGIETNLSFSLGIPKIRNSSKGYLYAELPNSNISQVDLNNSILTFSAQSTSAKSSNSPIVLSVSDFSLPSGLSTALFASFDEERYSVHYTDGTTQSLNSDQFSLSNNQVTLSNLTSGKTTSSINATFIKNGVQTRKKQYNRSNTLNVIYSKYPESGTGLSTSINDGLEYNQYYGLRVQDEEISLNYPDVSRVLSIYESLDTSDPTLDSLSFSSILNIGINVIIGENIIGSESGCVARVVSKSTNSVGIVYLNSNRFAVNEVVTFKESNITGEIDVITPGNYNDITNKFILDKGQKDQYYDYSKLIRNKGETEPSKKLLIVFDYYSVPSTDNGDVYTVASYNKEQFNSDVPLIGNNSIRASDTLDFRPKVPVFTTNTSSPFDFPNRNFSSSIKLNLSPDESSIIGYDYYLGRVDKIYLSKNGNFVYVEGLSSQNPTAPLKIDDLMELATVTLPPYLYNVKNASLSLVDNRRYTMRDIGLIENRVKNLERVTSLSLLELSTQTLQVQDSQGFNRFKTGFFVDDFKDTQRINSLFSSIEVDQESQEMRPIISRNSLKNYLAPAQNITDENVDLSTNYELLDSNVKKTGSTVTLKYESEKWLSQPLVTEINGSPQVENVNPYHVVTYIGSIKLSPERDNWVRTVQLPDKVISVTDYVLVERNAIETENRNITINNRRRVADVDRRGQTTVTGDQTTQNLSSRQDVSDVSNTTRSTSSVNNLLESRREEYMRSRNTEFSISNLKPYTRYYQFLDGNGSIDFVPKLIEIAKSSSLQNDGASSAFAIGETVFGYDSQNKKIISFRVAQPNHKFGQYNSPTTTFNVNPYIKTESLPNAYSASSKILNVDTFSLSEESQGLYSGYLVKGAKLVGQTSGSIAYVKDLRLISDNFGDMIGSFFIRDPNTVPAPDVRINTGNKTYKVTSSSTNEIPASGSASISSAETNYVSEGTLEIYERTITNTATVTTTRTTTTTITLTTTRTITTTEYYDPLAQSFSVGGSQTENDDENGAYVTAVDLFFYKKDTANNPLTVQIRTVELGTPTRTVIGNSVTLRPDQINISNDASAATRVTFDYPIYLAPNLEYAIVLLAPESVQYEVFVAEQDKKLFRTANLPQGDSGKYAQQFAIGSLFKSQNGSIWTAEQTKDMKFILYRANFITNTPATAYFYNPTLNESNGYIKNLQNNPLTALPRKLSIGITTTTNSSTVGILTTGRKISESVKTYNYGYIVGTGCSVSSIGITTGGFNYVTDTSVSTFNVIGNGSGLTLNITASAGQITNVTIVNPGRGYAVGDVVGIVTSSVSSNSGRDARITITGNNGGIDTLYLNNVQGNSFTTDGTANLIYYNNSNNPVTMGSTYITSSTPIGEPNNGNFVKVNHFNHGMYSPNNKVSISGVLPSVSPTTLSQSITASSTSISVASTANFVIFEGKQVSGTNPGYAILENEIIKYESVGEGSLETITRGHLSTLAIPHDSNAQIYKYEFNGVSLSRINTTHDISDFGLDTDSYYIEIDRSSNGVNRNSDNTPAGYPQLSFTNELNYGGDSVFASENIQYDSIIPFYRIISPTDLTSVSAKIRTVSGTSVSGDEVSFDDLGYENIQLNSLNQLSSTRIVCSKVNENTYLTALPRSKSFTTAITLQTTDKYLSPQIFLDGSFTDFHSNRINSPISNYSTDNRVNSLIDDPHTSVYVSNEVRLSQPATSLKVIVSAYRHSSADFRVLYSLIRPDSSEVSQAFELFPGYNNLSVDNNNDGYLDVVDPANNDGLPDVFVPSSRENEFLEYEFSANNLGEFSGYTIKIVMSSTNQAYPPRFKDLRSIAIR